MAAFALFGAVAFAAAWVCDDVWLALAAVGSALASLIVVAVQMAAQTAAQTAAAGGCTECARSASSA